MGRRRPRPSRSTRRPRGRTSTCGTSTARRPSGRTSRPSANVSTRSSTTPPRRTRPRGSSPGPSARGKILLNPEVRMNKTELAKKAIYEIGGNYQAIAVYDEAAEVVREVRGSQADTGEGRRRAERRGPATPRSRAGRGGDQGRGRIPRQVRRQQADADRADPVRHRRALRFDRGLGPGQDDAPGGHGTASTRRHRDIQVQAHVTLAQAYVQRKAAAGRRRRRVRQGPRASGPTPRRRSPR